ncbi:MAG: Trk system potassium transporter TrkA, partial [Clostridia bacterium]|nr:Trk system potassium transporter TrkA [Clostridia bacterium]
LKDLKIKDHSLVAVIARKGHARVPFGDDVMQADDHVVIITKETGITDLEKVFW